MVFCLSEDGSRPPSGKANVQHVFISYNWTHQSTIVQLANKLKVLQLVACNNPEDSCKRRKKKYCQKFCQIRNALRSVWHC